MKMLALLAALLAGCYQPSIDRCVLACSANQQCPDGLTCNTAIDRCASAADDPCDDVPLIDAPPPDGDGMNRATVLVRDARQIPIANAQVLFVDPMNTLIATVPTDAGGIASAVVPLGSSATVVRRTGSSYEVTTFLDLWADARVTSQFDPDSSSSTVNVIWNAAPTAPQGYELWTTCFGNFSTTNLQTSFQNPNDCPRTDVIVMTPPGTPARVAAVKGNQVGPTIDMKTQPYESLRSFETTIMNRPPGNIDLGFGAWLTPALAMAPPIGVTAMAGVNMITHQLPMGTGLTADFTFTLSGATAQHHYDKIDPLAQMYVKDLGTNVVLPFDSRPSANLATRRATWTVANPPGFTPAMPNVVLANLAYTRGTPQTLSVRWRLIGRGSLIVSESATVHAITFPDIPGTNEWEPLGSDATSGNPSVQSLLVTPAAERGVRAILEPNRSSLRLFEVPELRSISHSRAQ